MVILSLNDVRAHKKIRKEKKRKRVHFVILSLGFVYILFYFHFRWKSGYMQGVIALLLELQQYLSLV